MTDPSTNRFIEKALGSRSGPYVWLRKNYAEIAAAFAAQARPSWTALAKAAADDGNLFTPDTLRKAWRRLERDRARAGRKPEPTKPVPQATATAARPVAPTPAPTPGAATDAEEEWSRLGFRPSGGAKDWTKK